MTGFFLAWAAGQGIIFYRWGKLGAPPTPGVLALATGLFAGLSVVGDVYRPARPVVTAFAWAVDLAILMQVLGTAPAGTTGWPPDPMSDTSVFPGASAAASAAAPAASSSSSSSSSVPVVAPNQLAG